MTTPHPHPFSLKQNKFRSGGAGRYISPMIPQNRKRLEETVILVRLLQVERGSLRTPKHIPCAVLRAGVFHFFLSFFLSKSVFHHPLPMAPKNETRTKLEKRNPKRRLSETWPCNVVVLCVGVWDFIFISLSLLDSTSASSTNALLSLYSVSLSFLKKI